MSKKKDNSELTPKKVEGRITTLKVTMYRKDMIYIRMIDGKIFEYLVVHEGQLYSTNLVITPAQGKSKLNDTQVAAARELIASGAMTTIDMLYGDTISKEEKELVDKFESVREQVNYSVN